MYNLRYHIASLVSVFLALALGLVLGGLIVQRGTFAGQPQALVEGLREEFASLRVENRELAAENEQLTAFSAAFTTDWVNGRLTDDTVVIVTNSGRNDGLSATRAAVEDAGGSAAVVTMLSPRFGLDDDEMRAAVESLTPDPANAEESIATSLAAEWAAPDEGYPLTRALEEAGVLTVEGLDKAESVAGLVNVAASEGKADPAGVSLAASFGELELPVVGAQGPASKNGIAPAVADAGLSAIDTLGTEIGRYSLVALLDGAEPGYYGSAQRAKALFPSFEEKQTEPAPQ